MSKAPATQLYWKDWTTDTNLGRCSWAAQGVWIRVLALMHDSPEYGVLRWPLKEIAATAHVPLRFLIELSQKNVLKGGDAFDDAFVHVPRHAGRDMDPVVLVEGNGTPCWFSSRFVRDKWAAGRRGKGSRFTEENQPGRSPVRRLGDPQGDGPASASAFALDLDTLLSADSSLGGAHELALAMRQCGYSECSSKSPDLLRAMQHGITPQELSDVAKAKPGKPLAYVVARAIGKRADSAERAAGDGGAPSAALADPAKAQRDADIRKVDDQMRTVVSDYRHGIIDATERDKRLEPLRERLQALKGDAS